MGLQQRRMSPDYGIAPLRPELLKKFANVKQTPNLFTWLSRETQHVAKVGYNGTYIDLNRSLLRYFNVSRIAFQYGRPELGTITASGEGYTIELSNNLRLHDQRFVLFHELAHTFWLKSCSLTPIAEGQFDFDETLEALCDLASAWMLCPDFAMDGVVSRIESARTEQEFQKAWERAIGLADTLRIPLSVVMRRLLERLSADTIAVTRLKIEQFDRQLSLFEDRSPRLRSRELFARQLEVYSGTLFVSKLRISFSTVFRDKASEILGEWGTLEKFADVLQIDRERMATIGQIRDRFRPSGYYLKTGGDIVLIFRQS